MPTLAVLGSVDAHKLVPNLLSSGAAGGEWPTELLEMRKIIGNLLPKFIRARCSWAGVTGGDGTSLFTLRMVQCPIATTPPAAAHQGQLLVKPITANALDSATTNESVFTGAAPADGTARGTLWFSVPANVATSEVAPTVGPFIAVRCTNAGLAYAATGLIVIGLDFIG